MSWLKSNITFSSLYPSFDDFKTKLGLVDTVPISDKYLKILYFKLYGKWSDSQFIYTDEMRIHANIFIKIYDFGRAWEEKEKLQDTARSITLDEAKEGSVKVYNTAQNQADLSTNNTTATPMDHVDVQNAELVSYNKVDSLLNKRQVIDEGLVDDFIRRAGFRDLFKKIWSPIFPVFVTTIDTDEEEEDE